MTPTISECLARVRTAPAASIGRLWFVPLVGVSDSEPEYRLYGPSLAKGLEIREVGAAGKVTSLCVRNRLRERVLLIDSDTFVGLKQNRTLNTDVLVPAGGELEIPVSCVEQGRWSAGAGGYRGSAYGGMSPLAVRAVKLASVSDSVLRHEGHQSSQAGVWGAVAACLAGSGTHSESAAVHDALRSKAAELEAARSAMRMPVEALGVAVVRRGRALGLDLFDRCSSFEARWRTLVDGYVLDELARVRAAESPRSVESNGANAAERTTTIALATIASVEWRAGRSPGEGTDLRGAADGLVMSALVWNDRHVVHLQAVARFANPSQRSSTRAGAAGTAPRSESAEPPRANGHTDGGGSMTRIIQCDRSCAGCGFPFGVVRTALGLRCERCRRRKCA